MEIVIFLFIVLFIFCLGIYLGRNIERRDVMSRGERGFPYLDRFYICKVSEYSNLLMMSKRYEELKGSYDEELEYKDSWRWKIFNFITSFGGYVA